MTRDFLVLFLCAQLQWLPQPKAGWLAGAFRAYHLAAEAAFITAVAALIVVGFEYDAWLAAAVALTLAVHDARAYWRGRPTSPRQSPAAVHIATGFLWLVYWVPMLSAACVFLFSRKPLGAFIIVLTQLALRELHREHQRSKTLVAARKRSVVSGSRFPFDDVQRMPPWRHPHELGH